MTNQPKDPKPTPGAINAAYAIKYLLIEKWGFCRTPQNIDINIIDTFAAIIDQETATPELLEACQASMAYWQACADSARKHGACDDCVDGSPQLHSVDDASNLQTLCNVAAEKTAFAIAKAQGGQDVKD